MAQTEEVVGKLDEKMSQFYITNTQDSKSSDFEEKMSKSLKEIEGNVNKLLKEGSSVSYSGSSSAFTAADRNFITGMKNETLEALEDMRLEVLTASDKSKFDILLHLTNSLIHDLIRFCKDSYKNQGIQ